MTATAGYILAALLAAAIVFIGARFLVAPGIAAVGYGVPTDPNRSEVRAYLSVKGVRDIATGLFVAILLVDNATHLAGWVMLAATLIPIADAAIVLRHGGAKPIAYGVHGGTAVVLLLTAALLLVS
ncbi:hypothetical protein MycrhN_1757 [Mycolicibacterium rhodesiae NBB3]|jgi:hypothetical protein|uniref:Small membrane hydrophobic protein n=1 Tax=Mycolicibacterium rhodesiae (strain NBB3) TaxID=710685 RepID=G8RLA6_MYCRN|nr:DUF4267 domain-containing protein [Mycolicibacterium rhodesiae]AEV72368.1 hypothetical protein MycrhN_1757 [Mycolicibacterium rhodesiae NBB3]